MSPGPAVALLAAAVATALLATHTLSLAVLAVLLAVVCARGGRRMWMVFAGLASSATFVLVLTPLVETIGSHPLWNGPVVPVVGRLDVTTEELWSGAHGALRLLAVGLAFAAYGLLLDHDRILDSAGFARRFVLSVVLATRLAPSLAHDAHGFADSLRARGVEVHGIRRRVGLLSPLVAESLERALNVAEAMEARGFGRAGRTRLPRAPWTRGDRIALVAAPFVIAIGAVWL